MNQTVILMLDITVLMLVELSSVFSAGSLPPPSCTAEPTQWNLTKELIGKVRYYKFVLKGYFTDLH